MDFLRVLEQPHQGMQKIPSILHQKSTFSILHNQFYKTPTSVHLLFTIFHINNIFIFFYLPVSFSNTSFSFFFFLFPYLCRFPFLFFLFFLLSLTFKTQKQPEQELHQHHSHHKHYNTSPIHRSPSTQKHHHKHSINTDLHQPTKLISINTDLRQPITSTPSTPISIKTDLHQHRSPSTHHQSPSKPIHINHHRSPSTPIHITDPNRLSNPRSTITDHQSNDFVLVVDFLCL